jgi:hypothetical protein
LCDPNFNNKKTTQLLFIKQIAKINPTPKIGTRYVFRENWNQNWNCSLFFVSKLKQEVLHKSQELPNIDLNKVF